MAEKSASLENEWSFGPEVPTSDFFQHRDVRDESQREWLVNDLIYALERGDFLRWEAVVCHELGLPLTERQRRAVGELLSFNDEPDEDRMLYIDGIPRPRHSGTRSSGRSPRTCPWTTTGPMRCTTP